MIAQELGQRLNGQEGTKTMINSVLSYKTKKSETQYIVSRTNEAGKKSSCRYNQKTLPKTVKVFMQRSGGELVGAMGQGSVLYVARGVI